MSDDPFSGDGRAKRNFVKKCFGDWSESPEDMTEGVPDNPVDWGEDEDANQLIAQLEEPELGGVTADLVTIADIDDLLDTDDSSIEVVPEDAYKLPKDTEDILSGEIKYKNLTPSEKQLLAEVARQLTKMGSTPEISLKITEKRSSRTTKHIQLRYGTAEGNGFDTLRSEAIRKAAEKFLVTFNKKYFPEQHVEDSALAGMENHLKKFCRKTKLPGPTIHKYGQGGKYYCTVSVGNLSAEEEGPYLVETINKAAKLWLDLHGGDWRQCLNLERREKTSLTPATKLKNRVVEEVPSPKEKEVSAIKIKKGMREASNSGLKFDKIITVYRKNEEAPKSQLEEFKITKEKDNHRSLADRSREGARMLSKLNGLESGRKNEKRHSAAPASSCRSPRRQLLREVFDSSCDSVVEPTPQKPWVTERSNKRRVHSPRKRELSLYKVGNKKQKVDNHLFELDLLLDPGSEIVATVQKSVSSPSTGQKSLFANFDAEKSDSSDTESDKFTFSAKSTPQTKSTSSKVDSSPALTSSQPSSAFSFSSTDKENFNEKKTGTKKRTKKTTDKKTEAAAVEAEAREPQEAVVGSSVFRYEEDSTLEKLRTKLEKQAGVKEKRKKVPSSLKSRKSLTIDKYNRYSQLLDAPPILGEEEDKKSEKSKKKTEANSKQRKITGFFSSPTSVKPAVKTSPDLNDLLRLPSKSRFDDPDVEKEFDPKFQERIRQLELEIEQEKAEEKDYQRFQTENAKLRDRLGQELTESIIRNLFKDNLKYLKGIRNGEIASDRHTQYLLGGGPRCSLMYRMITDPFTDEQLTWTLEEISKVWMRTKEEKLENNDYIWKVLLAECFIKFYMDHFDLDKREAERRIRNTPLPGEEILDSPD